MENKKKYYLVSFGNSNVYRLICNEDSGECDRKDALFTNVEKELNDYLKKEFPGGSFTYVTSPKVTEISAEDEKKYHSYPELDAKAVEEIKQLLKREVETMEAVKKDNVNAIYDKIK